MRHEYEVTPKSAVQGWVMPATVTYEASSEPGSQQACSPSQEVFGSKCGDTGTNTSSAQLTLAE